MPKTLIVGAALLLASTAIGVTLAAPPRQGDREVAAASVAGETGHRRHASEHGGRRHHDGHHRRHAEDDDDEGDEGGSGGGGQPRMADPKAPVPDNGLFNGKTRPKVDVQ
ncbi:MAG: hypothetical protein U1E62_20950 [Alsobacter sp.]